MAPRLEEAEGAGRRGLPSLLGHGGTGKEEYIASDVTQASFDPFSFMSTLVAIEVGWESGEAHRERLFFFGKIEAYHPLCSVKDRSSPRTSTPKMVGKCENVNKSAKSSSPIQ